MISYFPLISRNNSLHKKNIALLSKLETMKYRYSSVELGAGAIDEALKSRQTWSSSFSGTYCCFSLNFWLFNFLPICQLMVPPFFQQYTDLFICYFYFFLFSVLWLAAPAYCLLFIYISHANCYCYRFFTVE